MRSRRHDPIKAATSCGPNFTTFMRALRIAVVEDRGVTIEDIPIVSINERVVRATFQKIVATTQISTGAILSTRRK
jgi:hypothetical protein